MIDRRTNGQGFNSMSFVRQKISVDRLDLLVVIVYVGVYSKTICTRVQGT